MTDEVIAFPHNPHTDVEGMTLRDYFAAATLQGLLANPKLAPEITKHGGARGGWIEESAWAWAESMMKLRSENHSGVGNE